MRILLDANVLFSPWTTDVIMSLADAGMLEPTWSDRILEELVRAAERQGRGQLVSGMVGALNRHYPESCIDGWEDRVESIALPDPDDRHVVAAAVEGACDIIVTYNLRDFPQEALGVLGLQALSPDDLLMELIGKRPVRVFRVIEELVASKRRPPRTYDQEIEGLRRCGLRRFADWLDS